MNAGLAGSLGVCKIVQHVPACRGLVAAYLGGVSRQCRALARWPGAQVARLSRSVHECPGVSRGVQECPGALGMSRTVLGCPGVARAQIVPGCPNALSSSVQARRTVQEINTGLAGSPGVCKIVQECPGGSLRGS